MNRYLLVCTLFAASSAALAAQDASQTTSENSQYQGVSRPPSDDVIVTSTIPAPKPPAGQPLNAQPAPAVPAITQQLTPHAPQPAEGADNGMVQVAPAFPAQPAAPGLTTRAYAWDPDGDIVHPQPPRPGELQEGTQIRVHLLDRLSTSETEKGQPFRTQVATDVLQNGQVLIPAGAEIDGRVVQVSSGHAGGHGTMRLDPESVVMPNGTRYRLHAAVTATPGSGSHVVGEGIIRPDSRARRDGIEYGGAVGTGVVVGAVVAGPAGALTGGLIGAGAITVHLLVSHPQATLESGSTLIFQLTDGLYLAPEVAAGN